MTNDQQFLIEGITTELIALIIVDQACHLQKAIEIVYTSDTYSKLTDTRTGLYYQSPLYVYDFLKEEIENRKNEE